MAHHMTPSTQSTHLSLFVIMFERQCRLLIDVSLQPCRSISKGVAAHAEQVFEQLTVAREIGRQKPDYVVKVFSDNFYKLISFESHKAVKRLIHTNQPTIQARNQVLFLKIQYKHQQIQNIRIRSVMSGFEVTIVDPNYCYQSPNIRFIQYEDMQ